MFADYSFHCIYFLFFSDRVRFQISRRETAKRAQECSITTLYMDERKNDGLERVFLQVVGVPLSCSYFIPGRLATFNAYFVSYHCRGDFNISCLLHCRVLFKWLL
jgi:hypothetical protein